MWFDKGMSNTIIPNIWEPSLVSPKANLLSVPYGQKERAHTFYAVINGINLNWSLITIGGS